MKTLLIVLAVIAVLAIAGVAWAKKSGYCRGEHFAERVTDRVSRKLELDERHRAMGERKQELAEAFADFSDSLLPKQREKLAELIDRRMSGAGGRFGWAH